MNSKNVQIHRGIDKMGGWEGIKKLNFVMMKCAAPGATSGISVDKY